MPEPLHVLRKPFATGLPVVERPFEGLSGGLADCC